MFQAGLHAGLDARLPRDDDAGEDSDDLEMPVLKAEVPWPLPPPPTKAKNGPNSLISSQKTIAATSPLHTNSEKDRLPTHTTTPPAAAATSVVSSLCDKNYESNEKPKTSEKCYYSSPLPPLTSDSYRETGSNPAGIVGAGEKNGGNKAKAAPPVGGAQKTSIASPSTSVSSARLRRASLSDSDSDNCDLDHLQEKVDPEQAFDRLVHSSSKGTTATRLTNPVDETAKLKAGLLSSASRLETVDSIDNVQKLLSTPALDAEKVKDLLSQHSPLQVRLGERSPVEGRVGQRSPVKYEGSTSIWGKQIASFDLSDDYVNDYLREQQAKKIDNITDEPSPPITDLLGTSTTIMSTTKTKATPSPLTSPVLKAKRVTSRAASFDIIPACVPDSIGTEIDDIIQSGFITMGSNNGHDSEASQDAVSLSSMTSSMSGSGRGVLGRPGRKSKRRSSGKAGSGQGSRSASRRGGSGGKKARQKSTDNLHPNLLPEDYLDEVIGQYFNQDEEDSSGEEDAKLRGEKKEALPKSVLPDKSRVTPRKEKKKEAESSEEGNPRCQPSPPPARARIRPPASFFSMDFLEDTCDDVLDWQEEVEEDDDQPVSSARSKVKTELEIELEYKHILYGGRKRKGPKIGVGKKKKKNQDSIKQQISEAPKAAAAKGKVAKGKKTVKVLKAEQLKKKSTDEIKSHKTRR